MAKMILSAIIPPLCLLLLAVGSVIPKPDGHSRGSKLSDEQHFKNEEHNADYDHEAFLGEQEAKTFDQLTPEESIERLGKIVDKIDKNEDGLITQEELKDWIRYTQRKYILEDVERQWKAQNAEDMTQITWELYKKSTYGFLDDQKENEVDDDEGYTYKDMMKRDQRRWEVADQNKDGGLDKEEFAAFLHPEETGHMRDIVVMETMEDIDKNKDGTISLEEYIGDMYRGETGDDEPDWVKSEREQFATYRDKDGNGHMDVEEVKNWIIPPDYDHAEAEARHLIYESDADKDKQLTKKEILEKYDLFVGSQATDFGEALTRHDEF